MDPVLERARAGDRTARNELAVATAGELRKYVVRAMGDRMRRHIAPEDLCQEALLQALDALPALRADATLEDFRRLLLRNANWIVMDRGRRGRRDVGESASPQAPSAVVVNGSSDTRTGAVTRADDLHGMRALVARLDSRYGLVIRGRLAGKDFAEIAHELGETEANVRKRYQRAVAKLKEVVEDRAAADESRVAKNED